ncbi:MAG: glutamine-hydrolyzing carbamoyl-phosphate synthase small subunit [Armatimonadetes bacterium]|nr:glutamine-hydrolyzing carbamoyl-phosphate synthase small subunit [Armatimonadota bacterium]
MPSEPALLVLEDGTTYEGYSFGCYGIAVGEVVFNTGMTGYQEVLTDPSYAGQIVTLTYPLVGNYGINDEDFESDRIQVSGFVIRELCQKPSNWRSAKTLEEFLKEQKIVGIEGVDTRSLVKKLRIHGVMMGAIGVDVSREILLDVLKASPRYDEIDFVPRVSTKGSFIWTDSLRCKSSQLRLNFGECLRVIVVDLGVKFNILRNLYRRGCEVIVVPCKITADRILEWKPDGVLFSNGPGDPALLRYAIKTAEDLMGKVPLAGICLGHQILGWALGGKTFKLKFGHRGSNHPVKDLMTGKVYITTQNHGYAVDEKSLEGTGTVITHINLNDFTVEGLAHPELGIFSVQYHPEASPGPWDNSYIFDEFVRMMRRHRETRCKGEILG